jgi:exosortase/archaeosortase family protein
MDTDGHEWGWRMARAVAAGAAVFALTAALPDAMFDVVFCRVPAGLAAAYLGGMPDGGSAFALADGRVVEVTRACGGAGFFAMLCGLLAWRGFLPSRDAFIPVFALAAWGYTVVMNGVRVVAAVYARAFAEAASPERFWGAAHLAAGVAVFFPALLLAWWMTERRSGRWNRI